MTVNMKKDIVGEKIDSKEEPKKEKKKSKIKLIVILAILLAVILLIVLFIIPRYKEEGIDGIIHPTILSKEEQKYYDLYLPEILKYAKKDESITYSHFKVYYFKGVDYPIVVYNKEYVEDYRGAKLTNVVLFYIKDNKVVTKEYDKISKVETLYNTEKDELDYYVTERLDYDSKNPTYKYALLSDIIKGNDDPYQVTFNAKDTFETTYKHSGEKVSTNPSAVMFTSSGINLVNKESNQKVFYEGNEKELKNKFKKALTYKYIAEDLFEDSAREAAIKDLEYFNIKPGQKILENVIKVDDSSSSSNTNKPSNTKPSTESQKPSTNPSTGTNDNKPTSKCNSGFVYNSDDNKCYSNTDEKNQINRCESGEVDLGFDCGKQVDSSICSSNPDQYEEMDGKCIDKYTLHTKSMECPSGYKILWGEYGGVMFTGGCYRYMNPNN